MVFQKHFFIMWIQTYENTSRILDYVETAGFTKMASFGFKSKCSLKRVLNILIWTFNFLTRDEQTIISMSSSHKNSNSSFIRAIY